MDILNDRCSLCSEKIKGNPVLTLNGNKMFCNQICFKIYNDNIEKCQLNEQKLREDINSNSTSAKSKRIYLNSTKNLYYSLPYTKIDGFNNFSANEIKEYKKSFINIFLKSVNSGS
jgi:hypothetical protein